MSSPASPTQLWIEGNIGCGKSTLCREFAKQDHTEVVMEDMPQRLLSLFYENKKKYAFPFQLHTAEKRLHTLRLVQKSVQFFGTRRIVLDRSTIGDFIFMLAQMVTGTATVDEFEAYLEIMGFSLLDTDSLKTFLAQHDPKIVFLWDTPEQCGIRAEKRDRAIPLDYLQIIEAVHFYALVQLAKVAPVHLIMQRHGETLQMSQEIARSNMDKALSVEPARIRVITSEQYAKEPEFENCISFPEGLTRVTPGLVGAGATVVVPLAPQDGGAFEGLPEGGALPEVSKLLWNSQAIANAIRLLEDGCKLVLIQ